jgi:hypothetical protein
MLSWAGWIFLIWHVASAGVTRPQCLPTPAAPVIGDRWDTFKTLCHFRDRFLHKFVFFGGFTDVHA